MYVNVICKEIEMKKVILAFVFMLCAMGVKAEDKVAPANNIEAQALVLTEEQNQKLTELKERLRQEISPIWEDIQASQQRILEIEKKYFEEFWNLLSDEQKAKYENMSK